MKQIIFLFFSICMILQLSGCVTSTDFIALENRVASLEMENARHIKKEKEYYKKLGSAFAELEKDLKVKGTSSREKYADIKSDIDKLKNEMRILTGSIEESEHRLSQYGETAIQDEKKSFKRIDNAVSKNYQRLIRLENYMGFEPSGSLSGGDKDEQDGSGPDKSEQGLYKHAKEFLDQGKNDNARREFNEFLSLFPDSENADNARFWIAESYYRDKWYEKAILEYQKVIEKYPGGNKVPAALLKQGYAFANLGEKANSRLILKELIKKFSKSNEADIAREKLK